MSLTPLNNPSWSDTTTWISSSEPPAAVAVPDLAGALSNEYIIEGIKAEIENL